MAKAVLSKRERLAWFWSLLAMIAVGYISSKLIPLSKWALVLLFASMMIMAVYFFTPLGIDTRQVQQRMIQDNPSPLLPVSGDEVLVANLKV